MPKTTITKTEYNIILERRDGEKIAVIEAVTWEHHKDGRGSAGMNVAANGRQIMVLPLDSLGKLSREIVNALTYQIVGDTEDAFDLEHDAQPRIGLYDNFDQAGLGIPKLLGTYYTLVEARHYTEAIKGKGYTLRKIVEPTDNITANRLDYEKAFIEAV